MESRSFNKGGKNVCAICHHKDVWVNLSKIPSYQINQFIKKNKMSTSDLSTLVNKCNCNIQVHKICLILNIIYNFDVKCSNCNSNVNVTFKKGVDNKQKIYFFFISFLLFIFHIGLYGLCAVLIIFDLNPKPKIKILSDNKFKHTQYFFVIVIFVINTILLSYSIKRIFFGLLESTYKYYIDVGDSSEQNERKFFGKLYDFYKWFYGKRVKLLVDKKQEFAFISKGGGYFNKDYKKFKEQDDIKYIQDEKEMEIRQLREREKQENLLRDINFSNNNINNNDDNNDIIDNEGNNNILINSNNEDIINTNTGNNNRISESSKANYIYNKLNGINSNNNNINNSNNININQKSINGGKDEKDEEEQKNHDSNGESTKKDEKTNNNKNHKLILTSSNMEEKKDNNNENEEEKNNSFNKNNPDNMEVTVHRTKTNKSKQSSKHSEEKKNNSKIIEEEKKEEDKETSRGNEKKNKMVLLVNENQQGGGFCNTDDKAGLMESNEAPTPKMKKSSEDPFSMNYINTGKPVYLPYHNNGK